MRIEDFLDEFVDGYLFSDLASMAAIGLPAGKDKGAVGYPIVATTLSGMELLGTLLAPKPLRKNGQGDSHFFRYWDRILCTACPRYGEVDNLQHLVRELVRHGLAHNFLAKPGILITKGAPRDRHLEVNRTEHTLVIDCVHLVDDFRRSYLEVFKPIAAGTPRTFNRLTFSCEAMQERLREMTAFFIQDATDHFGRLAYPPTYQQPTGPDLTASFNFPTDWVATEPVLSSGGMAVWLRPRRPGDRPPRPSIDDPDFPG